MKDLTIELDVLVWMACFATGVLVPHYGFGWSWWLAVPAGVAVGPVLYLPVWFVLIAVLRLFGLVGPQHSRDVRRPHNLGRKPEKRG